MKHMLACACCGNSISKAELLATESRDHHPAAPRRLAWLSAVVCATVLMAAGANAQPCSSARPLRVALDVGHSKAIPGATSARGKTEYEFNKRFADELADLGK